MSNQSTHIAHACCTFVYLYLQTTIVVQQKVIRKLENQKECQSVCSGIDRRSERERHNFRKSIRWNVCEKYFFSILPYILHKYYTYMLRMHVYRRFEKLFLIVIYLYVMCLSFRLRYTFSIHSHIHSLSLTHTHTPSASTDRDTLYPVWCEWSVYCWR